MGVVAIFLHLRMVRHDDWRYASVMRLNRQLTEAEGRFKNIVESAAAGYFFVDVNGRFKDVNTAWLKMHGYDSRDAVRGLPYDHAHLESDAATQATQALTVNALISSQGRIPAAEFCHKLKDGSVN